MTYLFDMDTNWSEELKKLVPKEEYRKTIAKVFDESTIQTLHGLSNHGYFDQLEFIISTGKEAHVFRAKDAQGNLRAVKVYKTLTSDFRHMMQYIQGDMRFKKIKKEKFSIVKAWTQKEFKNLELARTAGARVPLPIMFRNNVLIMEFIGTDGGAAPTLKEKPAKNHKKAMETILKAVADMLYSSHLVHADLSEYNILNNDEELVLIDMGQGVLTTHPNAKRFFERDVQNIVTYFQKQGLKITLEDAFTKIKSFKPIPPAKKNKKKKTNR